MKNENFDIVKAVDYWVYYTNTYTNQKHYDKFSFDCFIHDVLYGVGVSINAGEYGFGEGYMQFKKDLLKYLKDNLTKLGEDV